MRVLLFGATGMVGGGVLRECLLDPRVDAVLTIGRRATGLTHPKLREIVRPDLFDLSSLREELRGWDACFFCLGISSVGRTEAEFRHVTYDLTIGVAKLLVEVAPALTFVYVSGAGTDSTGQGRTMWARVKGQTENALLGMGFRAAYMFRPGVIRPVHGIHSQTLGYRVAYAVLFPFVLLASAVAPRSITTTERVGRAMIHVALTGAPSPRLSTGEINDLAG